VTEPVLIEDVGIAFTTFVCRRRASNPGLKTRKLKAACGSYMTFYHDGNGNVDHAELEFNNCQNGCAVCEAQYEKAKNLIENQK